MKTFKYHLHGQAMLEYEGTLHGLKCHVTKLINEGKCKGATLYNHNWTIPLGYKLKDSKRWLNCENGK